MNQILSVESILHSADNHHISKHTSVYSILISIFMALMGTVSVAVSLQMDESSNTLSMALLTVGTILILVSLYRIFWKSSEVVYIPTGSVLREGSCYMDSAELTEMERLVVEKNFSLSNRMSFKQSGNGRLDYLVSKDHQFAAVQLSRFVPYTYEPISQVYYYTGEDAKAFSRYLIANDN